MKDWINYAKEKIEQGKQDAFVWYSVASRWFTMASILLYVAACIVAGGMVGPVRFIEFLNTACHVGHQTAKVVITREDVASIKPRDEEQPIPPRAEIPKRHKAPVSN